AGGGRLECSGWRFETLSARRERRRRTPTRRPCTVAKGGGGLGGEEENVAGRRPGTLISGARTVQFTAVPRVPGQFDALGDVSDAPKTVTQTQLGEVDQSALAGQAHVPLCGADL